MLPPRRGPRPDRNELDYLIGHLFSKITPVTESRVFLGHQSATPTKNKFDFIIPKID